MRACSPLPPPHLTFNGIYFLSFVTRDQLVLCTRSVHILSVFNHGVHQVIFEFQSSHTHTHTHTHTHIHTHILDIISSGNKDLTTKKVSGTSSASTPFKPQEPKRKLEEDVVISEVDDTIATDSDTEEMELQTPPPKKQ